MRNLSYNDSFNLMRAYSGLAKLDRDIIEKLFEVGTMDCTYSSLAKDLDADVANVRKSILRLEQLGVVYIVKKVSHRKQYKPMVACFLIDGWMDHLLEATYGIGA